MASANGTSFSSMRGIALSAALTVQAPMLMAAAIATASLAEIKIDFMSLIKTVVKQNGMTMSIRPTLEPVDGQGLTRASR